MRTITITSETTETELDSIVNAIILSQPITVVYDV